MTDSPSHADPRAILSLDGDLTISRAADLKQTLLDALAGPLDVDLSGITAIDGAGLQLLVMVDREAVRRNLPIGWHAPSRAVRLAFDRLRVDGPRALSAPVGAAEGAIA